MLGDRDPTSRFSDRVADYVAARPGYPAALVPLLVEAAALPAEPVVADLGSGTGLLSVVLLDAGWTVHAVEPDAAMAAAAVRWLGDRPGFHDVRARAEATGLPDASVDLVVAGTAFHWFDPAAAAAECARILRAGGRVAAIWNERHRTGDPMVEGHEALLQKHSLDYNEVSDKGAIGAALARFFGGMPAPVKTPNHQDLDRAGLKARIRSCSYVPGPDQPGHTEMMAEADALFDAVAVDGVFRITYDAIAFVGVPAP